MTQAQALPAYVRPDEEYLEHLAAGRFMIQRSRSSGKFVFYPRVAEPGTGALDLEWRPASGGGEVYAVTAIQPKPPEEAYNVVLVALDEGPRLMSRVEGVAAHEVKIGQRVKARIAQIENQPAIVFDLA
jgi:uncharacterized OB-fold protein